MGLFTVLFSYGVGRRAGRRKEMRAGRAPAVDHGDPECINYRLFCENYGSCDGQTCEYDE